MRILFLSIFAFFLTFSASSQMFYITFEGIERSYKVHLPPDYHPDSLYPLVFNLHGSGSNAIEQQLYCGFDFVADTAGIVMVYPNGVDNQWNVYGSAGVNDVGFISTLIDTLSANYSIDADRVYSTGMSLGGFMSYRLACELSDRIAAIASVTGLLVTNPCEPPRPFPVLQMHGTADAIVPYAFVPTTIDFWTAFNNCPEDPVITELPDIDTTDQSTVTVSYYGLCDDFTEVILYTINGGEHTWPGATILIGITNQDIDGSVEIWNFFTRYTLPASIGIVEKTDGRGMVSIWPNPMKEYSTIEIPGSAADYRMNLFDTNGRRVRSDLLKGNDRYLLERGRLVPGVYFIELTGNYSRFTGKLVIR